jgi:hypothetical protein
MKIALYRHLISLYHVEKLVVPICGNIQTIDPARELGYSSLSNITLYFTNEPDSPAINGG